MKKLFVLTLLLLLLFLASAPLFAAEVKAPSDETQMAKPAEDTDYLTSLTSGTGLILVGGAGAGITAFNVNRRKENEATKEIKHKEKEKEKGKNI